ncbi:MAG: hypothetical protein RI990_867 [Planctomycetota bacterium]|jgi:6-pyruvoyltetrahydropterin/6-carboxytetrahydropterin synthase
MNASKNHPCAPIVLRRTVRAGLFGPSRAGANGFAGIPPATAFEGHHEITVAWRGEPDPVTGYLIGIQHVDALVRTHVWPELRAAAERGDSPSAIIVRLAAVVSAGAPPRGSLDSLSWAPSPFIEHRWDHHMPDHALLIETFEFSASHRLHCPQLSDEENRVTFGKCNHPGGHGHNYRVAVAVRVPAGSGAHGFPVDRLERIVNEAVIDRFDHRHLNADCPEFATINPSVENIARVCHGLLEPRFVGTGAELEHVEVWETQKTSARYPA